MCFLKPFLPLSSAAVFEKCMKDDIIDEFLMEQLIYIYRNSDLDVFQLGANEQIEQIICAFDIIYKRCEGKESTANLPEHIEHILINLVHFSMSLWFSLEWQVCDLFKRCHLLQTLFRMYNVFSKIGHLKTINWSYLRDLGLQPWKDPYFKRYLSKEPSVDEATTAISATGATTIVSAEEDIIRERANDDDIAILRQEGLVISLLRLIKMFDAGSMEAVKSFSIRIISAWNQLQQQDGFDDVHPEAKRCLNMISHIYMMAVFEKDNSIGYDIDNMINDVRFYHKTISDVERNGKEIDDEFHNIIQTPAALIALTSVKMKQSFQDLAESVINDLVREACNTRFGAVAHSYTTYLLANILFDLNKQDVKDFNANIERYKRLLHVYVNEREKSERFALEEGRKRKLLSTSCNINTNVKGIYNYKAAIGKGNRRSNLINEKSNNAYLFDIENEKRYDPVFQTMPYNKTITNEFYKILAQSHYKGWHYARLVLLLKIVDSELKEINNWCYHPGLPTEFMLGLESKLSKRFIELAKIFERHIFMEQEFWLTAFYFSPDEYLYDKVMSCGQRYFRTLNLLQRGCLNETIVKPADKNSSGDVAASGGDVEDENNCAFMNAKYGLLSSTYDVRQIANMTGKESAQNDYSDLSKALRTLRLPENIIKDILTVTFSGRHANYTWAADWGILRKRCKALLHSPELKRKLVESNMAEANDRLKYLKVDYKKYQNLPQFDYGSIEEGYEGAYTNEGRKGGDDEDDDDMDDDDDDDDYEDDEDEEDQRNLKRKIVVGRKTKNSTKNLIAIESPERVEENEPARIEQTEISDGSVLHKRSSARRAAAVIASAMLREDSEDQKATSSSAAKKKEEIIELSNEKNDKIDETSKTTESSESPTTSSNTNATAATKKIKCSKFIDTTDFWIDKNVDKNVADVSSNVEETTETIQLFKTPNSILARLRPTLVKQSMMIKTKVVPKVTRNLVKKPALNVGERNEDSQVYDIGKSKHKTQTINKHKIDTDDSEYSDSSTTAVFSEEHNLKPLSTDAEDEKEQEKKSKAIAANEMYKDLIQTTTTQNKDQRDKKFFESTIKGVSSGQQVEILSVAVFKNIASIGQRPNEQATVSKALSTKPTTATHSLTNKFSPKKFASQLEENVDLSTTAIKKAKITRTDSESAEDFTDYDDIINSSVVRLESKNTAKTSRKPRALKKLAVTVVEKNTADSTVAENTGNESIETFKSTTSNTIPEVSSTKISVEDIKTNVKANDDESSALSSSSSSSTRACSKRINAETKKKLTQKMIESYCKRTCYVRLKRICLKAYERQQRLPTVRIKRINMQKYLAETSGSRSESKSNTFDSEENSSSPAPTPAPIVPAATIPRSTRKRRKSSTTPEESVSSDEEYIPKKTKTRAVPVSTNISSSSASVSSSSASRRRLSTSLSILHQKDQQNKNKNKSASLSITSIQQKCNKQQSMTNRNFSVVPRSASGMKVCISSSSARDIEPPDECIEILSSDDDDHARDPLPCPLQFANVSMPVGDLAQFEVEEI